MKTKKIPENDLYVAILDDDPKYSPRPMYVYSFLHDFGLYKTGQSYDNVLATDDVRKFIAFADEHRDAVLFCDPGALGPDQVHGEEFVEDRVMAKWLEDNPSRTLNVLHLLPHAYYSFHTFELKNVNFYGQELQWRVNQILYEWLFERNPLALFTDEFAMDGASDAYIKKLKEPVLTKICEKFKLTGKTAAERKKAISGYYSKVWRARMRKRGVKGY